MRSIMELQLPIYDLSLSASSRTSKAILVFLLLSTFSHINAERDFNFNDSQVPLLEPKDEPHHLQDPYLLELTHCQHADSEIILSLILKKHDWQDLNDNKRTKLQNKLSKFFAIPKEFLSMDSITKTEMLAMQKESMRHGSNKSHFKQKHLGRISFQIGCGSSYFQMGQPIAKQISSQIKDGSLDNITGEKFGWWIIWRKQLKNRSHRNRRQIEGSGEDDYDYDDDEEEQEQVETVTELPTAPTHAHRHHHGDNTDSKNDTTLTSVEETLETNPGATSTSTNAISSGSPASTTPPSLQPSSSTLLPDAGQSSTTYASTDYIEPKIENAPPMIKTRLQKFVVTSGKSFRFAIPEDTFIDNEDNTNLRLELTDKDGHELKQSSWIQFNVDKREIYGLALDDAVSKWQYRLTATDSGNESITETVEISVQQHRGVRTVNHEINIAVKINEKGMHNVDWELKLLEAIAETLGDDTVNSIVVREIRQTIQDPHSATFAYFNETLPTTECPELELNSLVKRLDASRLTELVEPMLGIKSITGSLMGSCQKIHDILRPKPTTHMTKNWPPMPRNQVDRVNATVGHLLIFKVPSDTFYDPNDSELKLTLKTKENKELNPRHWLQFDTKNQEFYGIPKSGDIGSEEYLLVAEDSGGLTATDALVVVVSHAPKKEFSVYFKAYLAIRHEQFNADLQRKFVERITQLHGDHGPSNVQIRSVTTHHDSDGTIVNFYNSSLYKVHNRCPEREIEATRNVYLKQDYSLRDYVKKALGPELNLTNLSVITLGSCHPQTDVTHREFIPTKTDEPLLKSTFSEEYMMTIILPAIIIITMILVASIIACCLHRRRVKSGKMELGDEEERKSFHTKGIPVIFQDELDEKPEMGNKSPIILENEKPPLLPPSYNTSNMNGDNDCDEYVPPPAVVVGGGREVRGKSPATPSYRKPPPYVSP